MCLHRSFNYLSFLSECLNILQQNIKHPMQVFSDATWRTTLKRGDSGDEPWIRVHPVKSGNQREKISNSNTVKDKNIQFYSQHENFFFYPFLHTLLFPTAVDCWNSNTDKYHRKILCLFVVSTEFLTARRNWSSLHSDSR